jgi:hypothetical protein
MLMRSHRNLHVLIHLSMYPPYSLRPHYASLSVYPFPIFKEAYKITLLCVSARPQYVLVFCDVRAALKGRGRFIHSMFSCIHIRHIYTSIFPQKFYTVCCLSKLCAYKNFCKSNCIRIL